MTTKHKKQWQWGLFMSVGLLIMLWAAGDLGAGGNMLANLMRFFTGTLVVWWGFMKSLKWW